MYYLIYEITNNVNGKIYIGAHKTNNLDDGYMGSGKLLKQAISRYGVENFSKKILFQCQTLEEMFDTESLLVNGDFVQRDDTYNLVIGGFGGSRIYGAHPTHSSEHMKMMSEAAQRAAKDPQKQEQKSRKVSEALRRAYANGGRVPKLKPHLKGECKHSEETKKRIRQGNIGKHIGERNSQFGTCWIYSVDECRTMKISKTDLEIFLSRGWIKGRKAPSS